MPRKVTSTRKSVEIERPKIPVTIMVLGFLGVGLTIGAVVWGRSDTGEIDVSAAIANSQYAKDAALDTAESPIGVASQEFVDMPNGGLVVSGVAEVPPAPLSDELVSSSTATTTPNENEEGAEDEGAPKTDDSESGEIPPDHDSSEQDSQIETTSEQI